LIVRVTFSKFNSCQFQER